MHSNDYLPFLYKMLKKYLWKVFLLDLVVETLQLVHEISSIKDVFWKTSQKFSDKHKKQPAGGALSKDVLRKFVKFTGKTSLPESNF